MAAPSASAPSRAAPPWLLPAAVLAVAALVALPILAVGLSLFADSGGLWARLAERALPIYLVNTAVLLAGVGLMAGIVGTGTAWLVTACDFPGRRIAQWALLLPFAMPAYVLAYVYTDLLDYAGPVQTALREAFGWSRDDYVFPAIRSTAGAVAMLALAFYAYVYLLVRAAFLARSVALAEAARSLGQGPWRAFFRVALPMARPGLAAGLALVLMETLADFGTVEFFGVRTFTTGIYRSWFLRGSPEAAGQLASVLMLFVLAVLALESASRGRARYAGGSSAPARRQPLAGWRAWLATLACFLPVALGFLLPAAALLHLSLTGGDRLFGTAFLPLASNTAGVACLAALLTLAAALLLGYGLMGGAVLT